MNDYENQIKEAVKFINTYNDFLIVSHVNPDGDTISSSLAIAQILKSLGKTFQLVNQDSIPSKFHYMSMCKDIKKISDIKRKFSNVITLDVADYSRAGNIDYLLNDSIHLLNIDHHFTNDNFGEVNLVSPNAAAAAEIIYDLVIDMNIEIDKDLATIIYTGILTDTGGFRYSNTTSKIMSIAANLLKYNIESDFIAEVTLETMTKGYLELLKIALSNLNYSEDKRIAWTTLNHDTICNCDEDTDGIINYTRNIEGVEVGIFFKEVNHNEYKVGLRSKRYVDVGSIAQIFGGGGHKRAAGFTYYGSLSSIKKELIENIKNSEGWKKIE